MDSLEFCKSVTADMIMSRLHLDVMYNGSSPSLVYMKSLYKQLKGYWAVALRPVDKDRLDKSYYLESESWNFQRT